MTLQHMDNFLFVVRRRTKEPFFRFVDPKTVNLRQNEEATRFTVGPRPRQSMKVIFLSLQLF
jgi:hypothetical protein